MSLPKAHAITVLRATALPHGIFVVSLLLRLLPARLLAPLWQISMITALLDKGGYALLAVVVLTLAQMLEPQDVRLERQLAIDSQEVRRQLLILLAHNREELLSRVQRVNAPAWSSFLINEDPSSNSAPWPWSCGGAPLPRLSRELVDGPTARRAFRPACMSYVLAVSPSQ